MNISFPLQPTPRHPEAPPVARGAPVERWADREWDALDAVRALLRNWWRIGLFVAMALVLATIVLSSWPKRYTAESLVLLDPRNQPNLQLEEVLSGLAPDDQTISSEVLVLQSAELAGKVVADLRLADNPAFNPLLQPAPGILARLLPHEVLSRLFSAGQPGVGSPPPPEAVLEEAEVRILDSFGDRLEVDRVGRSHAIRIAFTAETPELAADAANRLAARYLEGQLAIKLDATDLAQDWLKTRVAELQDNVQAAEQAVEQYRSRSGLIEGKGVTVATQQMAEINTQLITARSATAAARARLNQVQRLIGQQGDALSAAEVLSSPLIHGLKEQEVEVLRQRAELSQEYGPRHPRMMSVEAELADIREKIMAEVRQIVEGLNNELAVALAQEQALARDLERLEAKMAEQNEAQVRLRALEREAEASRNILETFLGRYKENSNQAGIQRPDARVLSRALPPLKPSSPRWILTLIGIGALALITGVAAVLAAPLLGLALRERTEGRNLQSLPVLALLPRAGANRWPSREASFAEEPADGPFVEAADQLANAIGSARSVAVISLGEEEGRPRLSLTLARSLARRGDRVLLVDGDLRDARLSAALGLEGHPGFAELLQTPDRGPLNALPDVFGGARILSAGRAEARSGGMGFSSSGEAALASLAAEFDRIVIDGMPLAAGQGAIVLAGLADAALLTVASADAERPIVEQWADYLHQAGATVLGLVLTSAGRRSVARRAEHFVPVAPAYAPKVATPPGWVRHG